LTEIATSVQGIQSPTKKIEDCIHEVQALEIKILNFNDAVAERLRAQHENEILRKQTDAQKEECTKLEEQVRNHRQTEDNLKTRYSKLEHELSELRDKARDHESEPSKLEQELLGMRQQSRNAEDSLQSKITELGSASQRLEEREHELAKAKVRSHPCLI
jgi:chromosome segregation ATPase